MRQSHFKYDLQKKKKRNKEAMPFSLSFIYGKVCFCFQNCFKVHKLLSFPLEMGPTVGKGETLSTERKTTENNKIF